MFSCELQKTNVHQRMIPPKGDILLQKVICEFIVLRFSVLQHYHQPFYIVL